MIVTVSGTIGSGKTTIANEISKQNFVHISAGEIMRKMAKERNLSLLELSAYAEKNFEIDREIDNTQRRLVEEAIKKNKNVVVEGRLAWFIVKSDLKIFLDADITVRAKRVAMREKCDYESALIEIKEREKSENKRFKEIYNVDVNDIRNYDLYLNTSKWSIEGIKKIILTAISEKNSSILP